MTIWAFKDPSDHPELKKYALESIENGESRFGWGWKDLKILLSTNWKELNDLDKKAVQKSRFLLEIEPDDWIVHINQPSYGYCIAVKVVAKYKFSNELKNGDFGHVIPIDLSSKVVFSRNDRRVHPRVSRSLKPRGHYQRVYYKNEFLKSIEDIKQNIKHDNNHISKELSFLQKDIVEEHLVKIANLIHKNFPEKKLEPFVRDLFITLPNVISARVNGSGFGTDHGADVIVDYKSGFPIDELEVEQKLVIQVKSFSGEIDEIKSINQIKIAIEEFNADAGVIFTTAIKASDNYLKELDKLRNEIDKPIKLLLGIDVAKFVLKYGGDLIFTE